MNKRLEPPGSHMLMESHRQQQKHTTAGYISWPQALWKASGWCEGGTTGNTESPHLYTKKMGTPDSAGREALSLVAEGTRSGYFLLNERRDEGWELRSGWEAQEGQVLRTWV